MTIKLNDVRVLKNILGDKYDGDYELPKYTPKKLNWDKWTQNREEQKLKILDLTQLSKPTGRGGGGIDMSPRTVTPQAQAEATMGAREVLSGWREEAAGERESQFAKEQARFEKQRKIQEGLDADAALREQERQSRARMKLEQELARERIKIEKERAAAQEAGRTRKEEISLTKAQLGLEKARLQTGATAKKIEVQEPRLYTTEQRLLLQEQFEAQRQAQKQEIQRRKDEADAGLIRYEQSMFGQFLGPKSRFVQTAGRVSENIGQNLGGSILGPFSDPGASKSLSTAITSRNAYIELVKQRYRSKKPPQTLSGASDIMAYGTAGERKRLGELNRAVERAQSVSQTTGFMGGTSGQFIIGRTRQQTSPNLYPFTQIGARGGNLGTFGPEALAKMGVTQSLTAMHPATKWDTIFSRGGTPEATDRISFLLGKTPDPASGMAKLKRFL